jgi:arylformamidase
VPNASTNFFIDGGNWIRNYALQHEPLVQSGAHPAIFDFINVQSPSGDLIPMYEQVRRAMAWRRRNADSSSGNRDRFC